MSFTSFHLHPRILAGVQALGYTIPTPIQQQAMPLVLQGRDVLARVLHGVALSFTGGWKFGRFWGTLLTFVLLAVAGVLCVFQAVHPFWRAAA